MFSFGRSNLAELHTALIEDALEKQLEESIPARFETSLAQLPVRWDELCHHGAGLLKTMHPGRAGVPILWDPSREIRRQDNMQ